MSPRRRTPPSGVPAPGALPLFARPALLARLDESSARRLTLVVAGAGFGKTTLLDGWCARTGAARLTITAASGSHDALARGIAAALLPAGAGVSETLGAARGPAQTAVAQPIAAAFADAIAGRPQEVTLVIDDLHECRADREAMNLVDALLRHAPRNFHLVVSSREDPLFALDRMRGRGEVAEITAGDLAFTGEETKTLATAILGEHEQIADEIWRFTAGWPAAVRMALEAVRTAPRSSLGAVLDGLRNPGGSLFDYLATELFRREPPSVLELIQTVAVLDRFTALLCEALGKRDARAALAALVRRGIVVDQAKQPTWFTLPALVREFALAVHPLEEWERSQVVARASAWFEEHGHLTDALETLLAGRDTKPLALFLHAHADELLRAGSLEPLIRASGSLPADLRDASIEQAEGQARMTRGDWHGALACFERAAAGGAMTAGVGWRRGLIHYLRGDLDQALAAFDCTATGAANPTDEAMLLAWSATSHWVRGRTDECRRLAEKALSLATRHRDAQAAATAHTVLAMVASATGDGAAKEEHTRAALAFAQEAGDVLQIIRIRINHSGHLVDEGRYRDALDEIDAALPLAELTGFANFHALGLANRGRAKHCLGSIDEALADLESARRLWLQLGSNARAYAIGDAGDVLRERGDLALARGGYEETIRIAETSGDKQALGPALAGLARVLAAEDAEEAGALAARALAESPGPKRVTALLASGWVALAAGHDENACRFADDAAAEARRRSDRAGLAESLELHAVATEAAAPLEEAIAIWAEIGSRHAEARARIALARIRGDAEGEGEARDALSALGIRSTAAGAAGILWAASPERVGRVAIQTLGAFRVHRGRQVVAVAEWQSRRARDLLKILVARRGRPTPREMLMEMLWPEEDPSKLPHRLSVALATVRAVLDPAKRHAPEHFAAGDRDAVHLDLSSIEVDVERFLACAQAALQDGSMHRLQEAEALYTGDFLEENAYAEWAVPLREEARAAYTSVARALARAAEASGRLDAAVRYRLRMLERDPYDEESHLELVATLVAAGRHGEARRRYGAYVNAMEQIGVEAAPFPAPGRAAVGRL